MTITSFNKIIIYYFSGTGNSKSVANWIKQVAEQKDIKTEVINISKLKNRRVGDIPENALIGFCSPTHGFNYPPIMLHFIFRFLKKKNNRVFLMNTRAGMKIGKYFISGISGIALWLSALVLKIKGYKIVGMKSIDLPSNWISLHPGLKNSVIESTFIKRKKDTEIFAKKLLQGKKEYNILSNIIQDLLIAPIAIPYYFIGRYVFAKSFIASKDCTHCNLCVEKCPINAIKIVNKRCFWTYRCESCMQCMNICPQRAIETAHGFIIGISYFIYYVVLVWLYQFMPIEKFIHSFMSLGTSKLMVHIINAIVYIFFMFFVYRLMHFLMRFSFFERLIVYTSLTKYKFWRRYQPSSKS